MVPAANVVLANARKFRDTEKVSACMLLKQRKKWQSHPWFFCLLAPILHTTATQKPGVNQMNKLSRSKACRETSAAHHAKAANAPATNLVVSLPRQLVHCKPLVVQS